MYCFVDALRDLVVRRLQARLLLLSLLLLLLLLSKMHKNRVDCADEPQ